MEFFKLVVRYFVKALAYICYVLIALYFFVSAPAILGYTPLIVISGSMSPTYVPGDVIYYKKVNPEELQKMDVITFQSGDDAFVTHRIVKIEDGIFRTQGDANLAFDPEPVEYNDIKGKVVKYHLPFLGRYISFINNRLYLVIVAVVILVSEFIMSNMKTFDIDKKQEKGEMNHEK